MAVYPFTLVNRRGSATIATTAVTVNTDNVVFAFRTMRLSTHGIGERYSWT